jgi:hypothetical protein
MEADSSRGRRDGEKTAAPATAATLGSVGAVSYLAETMRQVERFYRNPN